MADCAIANPRYALKMTPGRPSRAMAPWRASPSLRRRRLGILHGRVLCPGILYGRTCCLYGRTCDGRTFCARTLHAPDLFSEVLRARLGPRVLDGSNLSALLHEPIRYPNILRGRCWNILLHDLCRGCLNGLHGLATRRRLLLRRPGLELPEQGFRCQLTVLRLILAGRYRCGNFVAGRCVLRGRRQDLSIGVRRNQCRRVGDRLDCWRRLRRRIAEERSRPPCKESRRISRCQNRDTDRGSRGNQDTRLEDSRRGNSFVEGIVNTLLGLVSEKPRQGWAGSKPSFVSMRDAPQWRRRPYPAIEVQKRRNLDFYLFSLGPGNRSPGAIAM